MMRGRERERERERETERERERQRQRKLPSVPRKIALYCQETFYVSKANFSLGEKVGIYQ